MNIVITGAASGIGLEICRQFKATNNRIFAVCRKASPELKELNLDLVEGIELTDPEMEARLRSKLAGVEIDLLWNNAGVLTKESLSDLNLEQIRLQFEVNTLAPLRITHALLPQLKKGAKVAITSSRMGSIADNTSGAYYGYRLSKAAVNMVGQSLAQDLKPKGISVILLHPGYVKTKMTGFNGEITPQESAAGMIRLVSELNLEKTGQFWHTNGTQLPW